jgi:hypothetical protein
LESNIDSIPVLLEGSLGPEAGKVILYKSQDAKQVEAYFQDDPYVTNLFYAYELKTLWIAKETFCVK